MPWITIAPLPDKGLRVSTSQKITMKKFLAIIALVLVAPLASKADDGLVCPQVVLCDAKGHYYDWVDPNDPCTDYQHQFCTERQLAAKQSDARSKRLQQLTRSYAKCLTWAKRSARGDTQRARRLSERSLRAKV